MGETNVQNRTVVLSTSQSVSQSHLPAFDANTIIQNVKNTLHNQTITRNTQAQNISRTNQRELTVIVIDRSESMAGQYDKGISKLDAAVRAAVALVCNKDRIDSNDEIAMVCFNSLAEVLLDMQPIASRKKDMIQALQSLTPDNGTDINEGLVRASDLFGWNRRNVVRRIVLLTDGEGGEPLDTADDLKSRGVVIDVVGIGDNTNNVNKKLLKKVASTIADEVCYRFVKDHQSLIGHYTQLANKTATGI